MNDSNLNENRWQKLKDIFNEAVELTPEMRLSYLSALRLNEKTLSQELAQLIEIDAEAEDFLDRPVSVESGLPAPFVGETVGNYKIVREIERGGMGVVYEAARFDGEFEQRVAVKLVNRHFFTDELVRRFRTERRILAKFEHPNIVRLLDGGLTEDKTPYYVMEFVEGVPVDAYCRERNPETNEILDIFLQICSAVAYAHRQLIVHRDLKPSNILITKTGEVKLLDFGIAKILDADGGDAQTQTQNAPLTPAYASPEQIRGETIATASDIYSLGVILYELLTGKSPREIYAVSQIEIPRAICETEPKPPSATVSSKFRVQSSKSENQTAKGKAHTTSTENPKSKIQNPKSNDLDNIVLKAMRKEKEQRYDSVEQFADDIKAFLNGLPVKAHPQSFEYRAAKFVKRNRGGVTLATAAILLIIAGVTAAVWQSFEARKQQHIAEQRFEQVRKIANSFIFDYHDEIAKLEGSTTLRERIVSDGVNYLDAIAREDTDNPELLKESALAYRKIGDAQGKPYVANLGKTEDAIVSYGKAVALLEKAAALKPADDSIKDELVESYRLLANVEGRVYRNEEAQQHLQKAVQLNQKLITADENNVERKITDLSLLIAFGDANYDCAHYDETLEKAVALSASVPPNENLIRLLKKLHSRVASFWTFMGKAEQKRGNFALAETYLAKALENSYREVYYIETYPNAMLDKRWVFSAYHSQADILMQVGRNAEAARALEIAGKLLLELKSKNADDREMAMLEIWFLSAKINLLKKQKKSDAALAVAETGLNIALKQTVANPTNVEPISWTLNFANEGEKLATILKDPRRAANYRKIKNNYEPQFKEKFGADFGYVF